MTSAPSSPELGPKGYKYFTTHDPACDQCRIKKIGCDRELPSCSNCSKAKVECVRSNRGKRPNQTNRLVNGFETFGNRLSELENNVSLIHNRLDEFLRTLHDQRPVCSADGCQNSNRMGTTMQTSAVQDTIASSPTGGDGLLQGTIITDNQSNERVRDTGSLMSLFEDADDKINRQLEAMRPKTSLRDILACDRQHDQYVPPLLDTFLSFKADVYRGLSLSSHVVHPDLANDGAPLLLPPKRLLDPIVEPYFGHISSVAPIISRLLCLETIDRYYSPTATMESIKPSWAILFNYMILFCFGGRYMPLDRPSSDVDIASMTQFEKPFVTNIKRSFAVIGKLLAPELVNVQALLALTLISQRYFSEHCTRYLLNQACFVAKSMNLHKQRGHGSGLTADELDERRRVFWCVFTIDKDVSLLLGTPPNLHHYDCDVPYPLQASYDFLRRLDSSLILGKIYIMLYSSAASRASAEKTEDNIEELLGDLDIFKNAIKNTTSKETDCMHRAWQYLMLEHRHTTHHARLMVLRRSSNPAKYEQRLSEARQCIKTIGRIHVARTTVGGFMVLRRPFQWRPFAAFFELLPKIFTYPITSGPLEDLTLLKELIDMLRVVASADEATSYCGKLLRIAGGCVRIADEFVQQCLRHQKANFSGSTDSANGGLQRKRKSSPTAAVEDDRASKTRSPLAYNQHLAELRLPEPSADVPGVNLRMRVASPPLAETGFTSMGYDDFDGSNFLDMFPGWPKATPESFSFLNEDFFWGG